ncbi:MAG: ABC-type antimicrobial peptide transport system, ATPase component [Clostridia bacterium]|nr:ABC-type antimicrobial peptide transport system, ATPase component [Clostridia bacterium]
MIHISDMYKIYRIGDIDINALNGVSIKIEQHEFVAIVGPSGSGKSTLMNMIGCLDTPTSGEYCIDGVSVNGLNDSQLADIRNHKIGFIFQGFNLLQKLSALENVELPLVYQGVAAKERHQRSVKALQAVGLGDRLLHKPNELSGGQQQRVAIARALASDPPLILADEPTGNLDTKSGKEIIALLHELHGKGNTIVLITHDNEVAMQAKRVVRIQDGMITEDRKVV